MDFLAFMVYLGNIFGRDPDGTLYMFLKNHINEQMTFCYATMLDEKPTTKTCSPFDHGVYPELDDYDLLDNEEVLKYQSLIGPLQWVISLGRFDIQCTDMSMSTFHVV